MARQVFGISKTFPGSAAVIVEGRLVFVSGQGPGRNELDEGIEEQTRTTMDRIRSILEEVGSSMENVVKATVYLKDMRDYAAVNAVYGGYFQKDPPARTCIEVVRMPASEKQLIEIEAIALVP